MDHHALSGMMYSRCSNTAPTPSHPSLIPHPCPPHRPPRISRSPTPLYIPYPPCWYWIPFTIAYIDTVTICIRKLPNPHCNLHSPLTLYPPAHPNRTPTKSASLQSVTLYPLHRTAPTFQPTANCISPTQTVKLSPLALKQQTPGSLTPPPGI